MPSKKQIRRITKSSGIPIPISRGHLQRAVRDPQARGQLLKLRTEFRRFLRVKKRSGKHERGDTLKLLLEMEQIWRLNIPEKVRMQELRARAEFILDALHEVEQEQARVQSRTSSVSAVDRENQILKLIEHTRH